MSCTTKQQELFKVSLELEMDWRINEHLEVREINADAPGAVEVPQVDEQVREEPPAGNAARPETPLLPASLRNFRDKSKLQKPTKYQANIASSLPISFKEAVSGPNSAR